MSGNRSQVRDLGYDVRPLCAGAALWLVVGGQNGLEAKPA